MINMEKKRKHLEISKGLWEAVNQRKADYVGQEKKDNRWSTKQYTEN